MNDLVNILRLGGGDDFYAVRKYTSQEGVSYCDLYEPLSASVYYECPVLHGLGTAIDAPDTPWSGSLLSGYPRVFAVYRSSRGGSERTPVVVGVISNGFHTVLTPQQEEEAQDRESSAPENPVPGETTQDVSLRNRGGGVYVRRSGAIDVTSPERTVVSAPRVVLGDGRSELEGAALAASLSEQLEPLYAAVNAIISFCQSLGVVPPVGGITMQTIPGPIGPIDVGVATVPYSGESSVSVPRPETFESPVVELAAPK